MRRRAVPEKRRFTAAMVAALGLSAAATVRAEPPESPPAMPTTSAAAEPPGSPAAPATAKVESGPRAAPATETPIVVIPSDPVRWDERWPKFRVSEYVVTPILGVGVFAAKAIPPQPGNWRGVPEFDRSARNAVRMDSIAARNTADDASDLILGLMVNQLVVDATLVAWWGHDQPGLGYQMILMDMEALAVVGSFQAVVSGLVSRWRPFRGTCLGPVDKQTQDCQDNKQFTSFFSGHTSGAFTVAGLMCMHHAHIPLYGGGAREALTCAASFAAAASVGYLRMAADQHYLSDVLTGAAIGTITGLGLPWLLHYRGGAQPEKGGKKSASQVSFNIMPMPMGLAASGEF